MRQTKVVVIDYGIGNLLSVSRGLEYCGAQVDITNNLDKIFEASHVVLPGVGAFKVGMQELKKRGIDEVIKKIAERKTKLLCICLGMQMLLDESEEFGITKGLGIIPGRVISVPKIDANNNSQKIPHIGWNELKPSGSLDKWSKSLLSSNQIGDAAYFVHSFMAVPESNFHRIADCEYGGYQIAAVIGRDNITGCQFHPEKSGTVGLKVLEKFCYDN